MKLISIKVSVNFCNVSRNLNFVKTSDTTFKGRLKLTAPKKKNSRLDFV